MWCLHYREPTSGQTIAGISQLRLCLQLSLWTSFFPQRGSKGMKSNCPKRQWLRQRLLRHRLRRSMSRLSLHHAQHRYQLEEGHWSSKATAAVGAAGAVVVIVAGMAAVCRYSLGAHHHRYLPCPGAAATPAMPLFPPWNGLHRTHGVAVTVASEHHNRSRSHKTLSYCWYILLQSAVLATAALQCPRPRMMACEWLPLMVIADALPTRWSPRAPTGRATTSCHAPRLH